MSFTSISWFVKMFLGDNVSKNQRQSSILSDSRFLFFDIYNVAYIKVKPNSKKKIIHWYKKYGWQKYSRNFKPGKNWNFISILWCPADHILLCFLCSRYGNVIKNLKRAIKNFLIEICNDAQKITWQKVNILKTHL